MKFLNILLTLQLAGASSVFASSYFQEKEIKRELTQIRKMGETNWSHEIAREREKVKMKEKMEAASEKVVLND